jgi:hypothetical protein
VEPALHNGTFSPLKLLELVIHFSVAQSKSIASCGDGISYGQVNEGVMAGEHVAAFLPLRLAPLERSSGFLDWIKYWDGQDFILLEPLDWFERGHDTIRWALGGGGFYCPVIEKGKYLWQHPPSEI